VKPPPYPWKPRSIGEWREELGERAAIFEYLGGYARNIAEDMARDLVGTF